MGAPFFVFWLKILLIVGLLIAGFVVLVLGLVLGLVIGIISFVFGLLRYRAGQGIYTPLPPSISGPYRRRFFLPFGTTSMKRAKAAMLSDPTDGARSV